MVQLTPILFLLLILTVSLQSFDIEDRANDIDLFLQWLQTNNVTDVLPPRNTLSIHLSPTLEQESGLFAESSISRNTLLARIPFSISLEILPTDPPPFPDASWDVSLAAKLLREVAKGDDSFWKPYLDLLPDPVSVPWLELKYEQFQELQYQPTIWRVTELQREAIRSFTACQPELIGHATWVQFGLALNIVWTNAFKFYAPVSHDSSERTWRYMFLPVLDLMNHETEFNTDVDARNVQWDHLELRSNRYIPRGAAASIAHEIVTTEAMFLMHGHVPESNKQDSTVLFYNLEEAVEWFLKRYHRRFLPHVVPEIPEKDFDYFLELAKKGALRQLRGVGQVSKLEDLEVQEVSPQDDTYGNALMVFPGAVVDARLVGALAQLSHAVDKEEHAMMGDDTWEEDEELAHMAISYRCKELLDMYPTRLDQDEKALNDLILMKSGDLVTILTIKFRIAKKKALWEVLKATPDYEPPLSSIDHDEL